MRDLLEPLPDTVDRWEAAGRPHVLVEVREELTCWVVSTLEGYWAHVYECVPMARPRAVVDRLGSPRGEAPDAALAHAVARAEKARRRSIRPCADCGEPTPPEHGARMDSGFCCHGCMSGNHGVVF